MSRHKCTYSKCQEQAVKKGKRGGWEWHLCDVHYEKVGPYLSNENLYQKFYARGEKVFKVGGN